MKTPQTSNSTRREQTHQCIKSEGYCCTNCQDYLFNNKADLELSFKSNSWTQKINKLYKYKFGPLTVPQNSVHSVLAKKRLVSATNGLDICPSVYLSVCPSVRLSVCPSLRRITLERSELGFLSILPLARMSRLCLVALIKSVCVCVCVLCRGRHRERVCACAWIE